MIFSHIVRLALAFFILSSFGCGTLYGDHGVFRSKKKDYLKTGSIHPIELPAGMESRSLATLYDVPDVEPRDEFGDIISLVEYDVPRPDPINTEKGKTGVKIQKIGENRWVFLNASTSQIWPRTQNFLSSAGFPVVNSNPNVGLIETGAVIYGEDKSRASRFRVFIEKGVHPETTEIHVIQADFPTGDVIPENFEWPGVSNDPAIEKIFIDSLAGTLAQSVNNNSASLLGQNVGGSLKVEFLKNQEEPTMRLRLYRQRAMATVAHALDKEGFVIWDQAKDKGIYYVGYDPKAGKGRAFLSRMFGGDSIPDEAPHNMSDLLTHLSPTDEVKQKFAKYDDVSFGEPIENKLGFLVMLDSSDARSDVVIRDMSGEKLPASDAKQLLRIIRKNLI